MAGPAGTPHGGVARERGGPEGNGGGRLKNEHAMSTLDRLGPLVSDGTLVLFDSMVVVFTWLVSRRLHAVVVRASR